MTETDGCLLCAGAARDAELGREQVWGDGLWRLSTSVGPADVTPGFSYLEPRRHIAHITDLDGPEAATFGPVIARCSSALKRATGAELIYVYIFGGGIPHLAPHAAGDALSDTMLRGEFTSEPLPSGATVLISKDFPALPQEQLRATAAKVRNLLAG